MTKRHDGDQAAKPRRRDVLAGAGALGLASAAGAHAQGLPQGEHDFSGNPFRDRFQSFRQTFRVEPDPVEAQRIVDNIIRSRPLREGLIEAITPDIAENGNVVPVTFKVNCAMTEDDYPVVVHVVALDNPFPEIAKYRFTPANGEAEISFRCRMRSTSHLVFVAEMSDGTVGMQRNWVNVTLGACS